MMPTTDRTKSTQPELKFPVEWDFRIIVLGDQLDTAIAGLQSVFHRFGAPCPVEKREASKQGKYQALSAKMMMPDRPTLDAISRELAAVPGVKMIL